MSAVRERERDRVGVRTERVSAHGRGEWQMGAGRARARVLSALGVFASWRFPILSYPVGLPRLVSSLAAQKPPIYLLLLALGSEATPFGGITWRMRARFVSR